MTQTKHKLPAKIGLPCLIKVSFILTAAHPKVLRPFLIGVSFLYIPYWPFRKWQALASKYSPSLVSPTVSTTSYHHSYCSHSFHHHVLSWVMGIVSQLVSWLLLWSFNCSQLRGQCNTFKMFVRLHHFSAQNTLRIPILLVHYGDLQDDTSPGLHSFLRLHLWQLPRVIHTIQTPLQITSNALILCLYTFHFITIYHKIYLSLLLYNPKGYDLGHTWKV